MTLKNAALLALFGTILVTAFLVWAFVLTFLNVLRDGCVLLHIPPGAVVDIVLLQTALGHLSELVPNPQFWAASQRCPFPYFNKKAILFVFE